MLKPLCQKQHKVGLETLAGNRPEKYFSDWVDSLPDVLGAKTLKHIVALILTARQNKKPVVFAYGGHVVKTGCSPLIVDLIKRNIITAVVTNGSGAIHDIELALNGTTSEDVDQELETGSFGMVSDTMDFMNKALSDSSASTRPGLGHAIGHNLRAAKHKDCSILYAAEKKHIAATVHVAIGTDTVHMSPDLDGAALGAATLADFRYLASIVELMNGGVWINCGSAVILPEVLLKVIAMARSKGIEFDKLNTVNLDMQTHYRTSRNVLKRPVKEGNGHQILGHHEIILPLLHQMILLDSHRFLDLDIGL